MSLLSRLFASREIVPSGAAGPFDSARLGRIGRLRLSLEGARGERPGETRVRGRPQASGIEIEGFQSYSPGDDVRHLDWGAYGRLDQLLVRRFVAEREIPVHILFDVSASMKAPSSDGKFECVRSLVGALAFLALGGDDSVRLAALGAHGRQRDAFLETPRIRHRGRYPELRPFLEGCVPEGPTRLHAGALAYASRHAEAGAAFVVSDFLVDFRETERALLVLGARGLAVHVLQVAGPMEREGAGLRGRLRIHDAESGEARSVRFTERQRRRYVEAFRERTASLRAYCHRQGMSHTLLGAEVDVETLLMRELATSGLVRLG